MNQERVIRKLRKLLAMGQDSSSPKEAEIAMSQAQKLMRRYNIEMSQVEQESTLKQRFSRIKRVRMPVWIQHLAFEIASATETIALTERHQIDGRILTLIKFVGTRVDVEFAAYLIDYLVDQSEILLLKDHMWSAPDSFIIDRKQYKEEFFMGCLHRFMVKLNEFRHQNEQDINESTGQSLVVVKRQALKDAGLEPIVEESEDKTEYKQSLASLNGYSAAKYVNIHRGIEEEI